MIDWADFIFWRVAGGIATAFVTYRFMRHVVYVVWRVWAVQRMFDKPPQQPLTIGPTTVVGIVAANVSAPVRVKIEERGKQQGSIYWREVSRRVRARPFTLFIPEQQIRILVEPGDDVKFRAAATLSDWKRNEKTGRLRRSRIAELRDGDRAIVTGYLAKVEVAEPVPGGYRSKNMAIRTEYVLRPAPSHPMKIDAEHFVHEVRKHFRYIGWLRGIGFVAASASYINAVQQAFSNRSVGILVAALVGYFFLRGFFADVNGVPWFERSKSLFHPPRGIESGKSLS